MSHGSMWRGERHRGAGGEGEDRHPVGGIKERRGGKEEGTGRGG